MDDYPNPHQDLSVYLWLACIQMISQKLPNYKKVNSNLNICNHVMIGRFFWPAEYLLGIFPYNESLLSTKQNAHRRGPEKSLHLRNCWERFATSSTQWIWLLNSHKSYFLKFNNMMKFYNVIFSYSLWVVVDLRIRWKYVFFWIFEEIWIFEFTLPSRCQMLFNCIFTCTKVAAHALSQVLSC